MNTEVSVAIISGVVAIVCAAFTGLNNWLTTRRTKQALTDKTQDSRLDKLEDAMLGRAKLDLAYCAISL